MKWRYVLMSALAFASAAAARTIVNEDFEGSEFPPKGWIKMEAQNGDWVRKGAGGNHYAHGWVHSKGDLEDIVLQSYPFYVKAERVLTMTFRFSNWATGVFYADDVGVSCATFYRRMPYAKTWQPITWVMPPLLRGRYYDISFSASAWAAEGKEATIYFNVDDVRLTCCPPAVDPTSLGRVKALFR